MNTRAFWMRAAAAAIAAVGFTAHAAYSADEFSPVLAMVTGQPIPMPALSGGEQQKKVLEEANPGLSLLPESRVAFPQGLTLGSYEPQGILNSYNQLSLGTPRGFAATERYVTSEPTLFDKIGDHFSGLDVEWATGTQSSVYLLPWPAKGENKLIPFIDLLQDADEVDAHLRMGVGIGVKYLINKNMSIDAEVLALEESGDHNPATSSETRAMLMFTVRF
jgi:hypothetical protein